MLVRDSLILLLAGIPKFRELFRYFVAELKIILFFSVKVGLEKRPLLKVSQLVLHRQMSLFFCWCVLTISSKCSYLYELWKDCIFTNCLAFMFPQTKRVMSLDVALLMAGAKERGELEARVTTLISDVQKSGECTFLDFHIGIQIH